MQWELYAQRFVTYEYMEKVGMDTVLSEFLSELQKTYNIKLYEFRWEDSIYNPLTKKIMCVFTTKKSIEE